VLNRRRGRCLAVRCEARGTVGRTGCWSAYADESSSRPTGWRLLVM